MASKYLDLYTDEGHLRQKGAMGSSSAYHTSGWGTPQNVYWQGGTNQKVVHDQYNNKYYGTQKQSDLTKGLTDSIARLQAELDKGGRTTWHQGWMGHGGDMRFNKFDSKAIAAQNAQIKSQQKYLDNINNGMYTQESSTFFDSYDDWTGDWNNLFKRRYDNTQTKEKNRLQEIENAKILKQNERNQRISDRNQRENTDIYQGDATKSKAKALGISPNTDINTGMSTEATKLSDALLKDNGLSI